ncbi:MAG: type II toxin-antitoxin system RelE/ParE family toxin [Burkholderiales bacterium]|jgi:toxin ParE1/3/4|nr:type II toxin-antitoxin system RelE/ParE family toxin [Burkholderiales bacterium]MBP6250816.1 type II toxin-antitoxin system RelE/ParE family toxin [Leptothrix sp. (in: b-proteobacteria)]MBP7521819.1 type II toxin-antitoxin system RelE/ParE family toxin [Leptothrix sp. (in: b-proteobacteria)]
MTTIDFAPEVAEDFERILDQLVTHGVDDAAGRTQDIVAAIDVLQRNPCIGRPIGRHPTELRELVIGRRSRGYVALYAYDAPRDWVLVLAVRGQKEAGYTRL